MEPSQQLSAGLKIWMRDAHREQERQAGHGQPDEPVGGQQFLLADDGALTLHCSPGGEPGQVATGS